MSNYKEIVTKAIIGKAKKSFHDKYDMVMDETPNNILGCWVINHKFNGVDNGSSIDVSGTFDINVWYSYDNNSKTQVSSKTFSYNDTLNVNTNDDDEHEVVVRSLKQPTVSDVSINDGKVILNIDREMGVEIVGNTIVKVPFESLEDDYEDLTNKDNIDNINTDYLK